MTASVANQPVPSMSTSTSAASSLGDTGKVSLTPYVPADASSVTDSARPRIIPESSRVVFHLVPDGKENGHCYVGHDEEEEAVATLLLGCSSAASNDNAWSEILNKDRKVVAQWQSMPAARPSRRARRNTTVYGHSQQESLGTVINNRKFVLSDDLARAEESFWMGPISSNVYMGVSESVGQDSPNAQQKCVTQYTPVGSNGTPGGACFYHDADAVHRVELELPVKEDTVSDERRLAFVSLVAYQVGQFNAQLQVLKGSPKT